MLREPTKLVRRFTCPIWQGIAGLEWTGGSMEEYGH
jgi:hypothetical protein